MFQFNPIPEEELNTSNWKNIDEGIHTFTITEVTCDTYAEGSKMKISYRVTDDNGNSGTWYDNFSDKTQWKVIQMLKSIGRKDMYKTGKLSPEALVGKYGKCEMKNREYNGKTSLQISGYIEREKVESVSNQAAGWDDDESIPF